MPQVKEPIIRQLIKKALNEAELSAGPENTKFSIKVDVSNKQSETKLGLRIQLTPSDSSVFLANPDKKGELEAAIMTKMNNSLEQFSIQVSKDTDVPDPEVMGFFIPLPQLKNMIVSALKGSGEEPSDEPSPPPKPPTSRPTPPPKLPVDDKDEDDIEDLMEEEDPLDRAARLAKQPLAGMGDMTGLGLKRSGYEKEEGGELPLKELYEHVSSTKDSMLKIWIDIVKESDYKFKEYLENNEEQYTRIGAVMSMIKDELEDRLELEEPVGPDQGVEEQLKKVIKKLIKEQSEPLNEMLVRELKQISNVVIKEDFYGFINAGNNIIRTLEENGIERPKKYLEYLTKHNIM